MHFTEFDTRLAAYAVIVEGDRVLLSWFNGGALGRGAGWTLPGGGIEFGESLEEGVVREVHEETGYDVELTGLLTTHTFSEPAGPGRRPFHSARIVYTARIVGGELGTVEVGGTTDRAEWLSLGEVAAQSDRVRLVDLALDAWRARTSV